MPGVSFDMKDGGRAWDDEQLLDGWGTASAEYTVRGCFLSHFSC